MKTIKYIVYFVDTSTVVVNTTNRRKAGILAMAEKINAGQDYEISHIVDEYGNKHVKAIAMAFNAVI